jgi:ABC-type transport system involved in cytochrome c biogenesis permease subunit
MMVVLELLNILLPLGYLLAVLDYLVLYIQEPRWSVRSAPRLARAVAGLHAVYLLLLTATFEHVPVASVWEAFTFIAFALTAVYLVLEWRLGNKATGVFLLAPAFLFQVLASAFLSPTREVSEILRSSWFGVHVTAALIGYAAFAIAAVYGVLYILLYRSLKGSNVGLVFRRLPSLDVLSKLSMSALAFGWVNLTLAIIVGVAWVSGLESSGQLAGSFLSDPKFLSTLVIWTLYAICLAGRFAFKWPNRQLAVISVIAFVLMILSSMAVTLFVDSFHSFG